VDGRDELALIAAPNPHRIFHQYAEKRLVARQDAELAVDGTGKDDLSLAGPHHPVGRDKLNLHRGHPTILPGAGLSVGDPVGRFTSFADSGISQVCASRLQRMRAIVVIPTYNERDTIPWMIEQLLDRPSKPDILIVDDSSPDGTADLVRAAMESTPDRIHLLVRPGKEGLGRAYAAGFAHALQTDGYDAIVQMDADGSHGPQDVDRLLEALDGADLVIGSRYVRGGNSDGLTAPRELLSRGGNFYARALLRTGVDDLTGGFKAWRATVLADILNEAVISDGYGFQVEMTLRAARAGARIREVPITFHERRAGSSKMNWRIAVEAAWVVPWMARHYPRRGSDPTAQTERSVV
jgi:dolichol-phosphate mannosyltransferase